MKKELKLNLGCGNNKIKGFINIDAEKNCKPDLVFDFSKRALPFKKDSVSEVLLFHCIEHIEKRFHGRLLLEIGRVLKPNATFYVSYPNFWECAQRWHDNSNGTRAFWEATLYGRQLYKSDYHVCAMNPDELTSILYECGFRAVISFPEPGQVFNTVTTAIKDIKGPIKSYETIIAQDINNMIVREVKH